MAHSSSMIMTRTLVWASLVLFISCRAMAWSEMVYTDAQIVDRAELVVVGHLKRDSLKHQPRSDSHAVLVITRVIKGVKQATEIPISISLLPAPNTYKNADDFANNDLSPRTYDWTKPIVLFDNNPDGGSEYPLIDDIRKDQIWLLRKAKSADRSVISNDTLAVLDPQDVQPLTKEQQLKKYAK
jgi:hypothetical protein